MIKTQRLLLKTHSCFLFMYLFLRIPDISAFLLPVNVKHFHKSIHDDSHITLFRDDEYSIKKYI